MDIGNSSVSDLLNPNTNTNVEEFQRNLLPDISADSGFLVFIQGLECKVQEDAEKKKRHEDINISSARHVFLFAPNQTVL